MEKETQCIHSGGYRDSITRGLNTPIFTSSAYEYLDREDCPYPRYFNTPNQEAVVRKMCALEGGEDGILFSSGMAAMSTAILTLVGAGDHVVLMDELYGRTHAIATRDFNRLGIGYTFAPTEAEAIVRAATESTKVIRDRITHQSAARYNRPSPRGGPGPKAGDNDDHRQHLCHPGESNPLAMGIDVVVHSGTKYLGGHSDLCCGVVVTTAEKTALIREMARNLGGSLDANSAYLLERSLKTLSVRVGRQSENALLLAEFLERQYGVTRVFYPGSPNFPDTTWPNLR